jgi:hypothetical protein
MIALTPNTTLPSTATPQEMSAPRCEGEGRSSKRQVRALDVAAVTDLQAHVSAILRGGTPPDEVSPADAAPVTLAAGGSVRSVLSRKGGRAYKDRIEALSNRSAMARQLSCRRSAESA